MTAPVLYGLCGAALVAIGLWGLVAHDHLLRRILAFNLLGSGAFLFFGSLAARAPGAAPDPVPLAMIITGIVVALAATALALALVLRLHAHTGSTRLPGDERLRGGEGDGAVDR